MSTAAILAATMIGGLAPVSGGASDVDEERLAEELRFRQELGFSTDRAMVMQLMADRESYADRYPVALTIAEQAEFDRRVALEGQMRPLEEVAEALPNFAGHWIDQAGGGVIVVNFTDDPEGHRAKLQALVPSGAQLDLRRVDYALIDLEEIERQILADDEQLRGIGIEIGDVGVDISENTVVIGVVGLTSQTVIDMTARYGKAITLQPAQPEPSACTSREACPGPPLRAGISGAPAGVILNNRCSVAFLVKYSTKTQLLTAGHCAKTLNVKWYHAGNASWPMGSIKATCWPTCNYSDAARMGDLPIQSPSYWVYNYDAGYWPVSGKQGWNGDDEGDTVCLNARKAEAWRCGVIDHIGRIYYDNGAVWFDEMRFATYASKYGDSGGAVHSLLSGSPPGVTAYGIQSGCTNLVNGVCQGFGVYSHIYRINQELGVTECTRTAPCT